MGEAGYCVIGGDGYEGCIDMREGRGRTDPLEVSTDHPICRPSPQKVSKNRNQLVFVSSTCCSPCQSSSLPRGESTSFSSGSTSEDMRVGITSGDRAWASINSTWGRPSTLGCPPASESRPKDTSFGRGRDAGGPLGEAGAGEGGSAPSEREDDMLAVGGQTVLWMAFARATWTDAVAYRCREAQER